MAPDKLVTGALKEGRKVLQKHGFRNRFFNHDASASRDDEERQKSVKEDVIDNFLRSGRTDSGLGASTSSAARIPAGPGLSRWPTPSQVRHLAAEDSLTGAAPEPQDQYVPARPKRSKGLNVKFTDVKPEVIGEGGDESDVPTIEISMRRAGAQNKEAPLSTQNAQIGNISSSRSAPRFVPAAAEQGFPFREHNEASDGEMQPAETPQGPLPATTHLGKSSSVLRKGPPRSSASTARIQARRMQSEEGALHRANSTRSASPKPGASPATAYTFRARAEREANGTPEPGTKPGRSPTTDTIAYLSLTPTTTSPARSPARSPKFTKEEKDPPPLPPRDLPESEPRSLRLPFHDTPGEDELKSSMEVIGRYPSDNESDASDDPVPEPLIKVPTESALELFSSSVRPLTSLFRLSTDADHSTENLPLRDWIRAAVWWFVNGRADLNLALQVVPLDFPTNRPLTLFPPVRKAFVNLAKSWWIVDMVAPSHPQISQIENEEAGALLDAVKSLGDPILEDAVRMWDVLVEEFGSLAAYLEQERVLMHDGGEVTLGQGADTSIWVKYPLMPDRTAEILAGSGIGNGLFDMFSINEKHTSGRMLVEALVTVAKPDVTQFRLLCLFTLSTDPHTGNVKGAVASQSPVLSLIIEDDATDGPTWDDLDWHIHNRVVTLLYQDEMTVAICFGERDFQELRRIADRYETPHSTAPAPAPTAIAPSAPGRPNEALAYETTILCFQDSEPTESGRSQLLEPIQGCTLRLFEIINISHDTGGDSARHGGMRLSITGGPADVATLDVSLGSSRPILFNFLRGDNGYPAMLLRVGSKPSRDVILTFGEEGERMFFLSLLNGTWLRPDESVIKELSLKSMSITLKSMDEVHIEPSSDYLWTQPWARCLFIDVDPRKADPAHQRMATDRKRLCADFGAGTFTDRLSLGLGEVFVALSPVRQNEICVLRPRQDNVTITISKNQISEDLVGSLSYAYQNMSSWETVRRYQFKAVQDLHFFELVMTGFAVAFDGVVPSLSITRRRMVVSLHKKWEAVTCRVQVVKKGGNIQLLAFFQDFVHGDCMSLPLKGTDTYESFDRSGKFYVKIVEAKFPLPKTRESENRAFLSLDNPEFPSENDDILLTFDSETERARFQDCLPGSVNRISSFKALMK